jgi:hypothetical protein
MKKDTPNWDRKQHDKHKNNKLKRDKRRTMLALREKEFRQEEKQERKNMYYAQVKKKRDIKKEKKKRDAEARAAQNAIEVEDAKVEVEPNEDEWTAQKIAAGDKTALGG